MQLKNILQSGLAFMMCHLLYAQTDADELAKALQNPLASLFSLPFQGNFDYGIGPNDGNRFTLNIQPVVPMSICENLNLIARVILPVISQTYVYGESGTQTGLGDALISGFFSPKAPAGRWIWGAGPALLVPTATNRLLGGKKLGIGPTAVFLTQFSGFTVGAWQSSPLCFRQEDKVKILQTKCIAPN